MLLTMNPERMELAEQSDCKEKNCIGTLLYVLGFSDKDAYLYFSRLCNGDLAAEMGVELVLEELKQLRTPQKNSLFVMRARENSKIGHAGLIIGENPLIAWHRPGVNANVKSEPLERALGGYLKYPHHSYYSLS